MEQYDVPYKVREEITDYFHITWLEFTGRIPHVEWVTITDLMEETSQFFKLKDEIFVPQDPSVGLWDIRGEIIEIRPEQYSLIVNQNGQELEVGFDVMIYNQRAILRMQLHDEQMHANYLLGMLRDIDKGVLKPTEIDKKYRL